MDDHIPGPTADLPLDAIRAWISQLTDFPARQFKLSSAQIMAALGDLQRVDEKSIVELGHSDSLCPICLTPYSVILSEEEVAFAMDSPAHPIEELGIARLAQSWQCGHIFCRRDISKWISTGHDSCPLCRRQLLQQQLESSSQTAEELARAEASAQAIVNRLGEVGRLMRRREELPSIGNRVLEPDVYNIFRDEGSQNSGMYS